MRDVTATDYNPVDLDAHKRRAAEERRQALVAAHLRQDALLWQLSDSRGRFLLRTQLREAGFRLESASTPEVFDRDPVQMGHNVGRHSRALQLLWSITRLVALGKLPVATLQDILTENDA